MMYDIKQHRQENCYTHDANTQAVTGQNNLYSVVALAENICEFETIYMS